MADGLQGAPPSGDAEAGAVPPALAEATLRAVTARVYELMRDDIVVQRERRGLGPRWR